MDYPVPPDQPSPLPPEPGFGQPGTPPPPGGGALPGSFPPPPDPTAGPYRGYVPPSAGGGIPVYGSYVPVSTRGGCRRFLPWTLGCCGLLILLVVGGAIFALFLLSHQPLSGFPSYPGSVLTSYNIQNGSETEVWVTSASKSSVEGYYATALTSPWSVNPASEAGSTWQFYSSSGGSGTLTFVQGGSGQTTITASYVSSP